MREIGSLYDDFAAMSAAIARRSRYLRDFAAALSHEFKTPLAGLSGGIELLQDHGATMAEAERQRFLGNMAADTGRLSRLVGRLMELAKADMGRADPAARAAVGAVLAQTVEAQRRDGLAIAFTLPAGLPPVAVDPAALETIASTLIENAAQAGATRLDITARRDGDELAICFADDGPGIPTGDRERVFDPFFTSKRDTGGTGLGLPIARALAENGHGRLALEASEMGTTFVLTLPLAAG